jgi:hypothetical protein
MPWREMEGRSRLLQSRPSLGDSHALESSTCVFLSRARGRDQPASYKSGSQESTALAGSLHHATRMSEKRPGGDAVQAAPGPGLAVLPAAALPDLIRCSVCEHPLLRARRDTLRRSVMVQCGQCGALQHRHL